MKKTLLATAIAGAMAASGAQAATVYNQDGTKLDLYGNIQIAYWNLQDENSDSKDELGDNGSTFGFAAEHVIYDGLVGYMKLEFDDFKADEIKVAGRDAGDQAYVGLKGNFGDVRLGSYDPLIDDWIQDPISNNEFFDVSDSNGDIVDFYGTGDREGDKLTYTSPSLSGLQFAVGTQYKGDGEAERFDGVEADGRASFFGGAKYTVGGFSIAAVYDNLDIYDATLQSTGEEFEAGDMYGITGQYTWNNLRVALKAERFEADEDELFDDVNRYGIGARYGYGMGDIYAAYQYVDVGAGDFGDTIDDATSGDYPNDEDEDASYNEVIVGATYNISDAMYTWAELATYDRDNDEGDGAAVGVTYLF
ncbi:porin [Halomonas organivorans]|uniref:Putative porin n=1 Tax=Halomonas organivorans TaxID=257772 RepID=A0A7W5C2Z3_9GAMM|nr:porin [Halomonas organivorans]MBB3143378.1 putative porin [Halomonas organivorans]